MLRVGFDIRALSGPSSFRGVGKYTAQLLTALRSSKKVRVVEIKDNTPVPSIDLIHYPFFDFFFLTLPLMKRKKTVVTIHDCTPLVFPKYYPSGIKGKLKLSFQKLSLKSVAVVLADSENSKKDIIRFLGVPEKKIHVTYLAADKIYEKLSQEGKWMALTRKRYQLPEKFLLYVGDINYNKNLPRLITAFKELALRDCTLVLVGKAFKNLRLKEAREIAELIKELKLKEKVKVLGFVPDNDLVKIYNLAQLGCFPSLYEGFGLGALEAMACGCPVLASNTSSLPEVVGRAAFLVDPYSTKNIAQGMKTILEDERLRQELIGAGLVRAKEFSWEKTAQETIGVYQRVVANQV
jgi:glycosyltransferase involved in cell wall biosynthesis